MVGLVEIVGRSRLGRGDPLGQLHDPGAGGVEVVDRQGATIDRIADLGIPGALRAGHLEVHAGVEPEGAVRRRVPVAHHHAVEAPALAEHPGEQGAGLAHVLAVDPVVRRHEGPGARLADHDLEPGQVELVERALVDHRIDAHAVVFLVVGHEVLGAGTHALGLDAAHHGGSEMAGEKGIFGEVLEVAAPGGVALQVEGRSEDDVDPVAVCLGPERGADLPGQRDVPARAERDRRRKAGGRRRPGEREVIAVVGGGAQTVRTVGQVQRAQAELRSGRGVPEVGPRHEADPGVEVEAVEGLRHAGRVASARVRGSCCILFHDVG